MKLVYEKREVIEDIAATHLGSQLTGYYLTSDKETTKKHQQQKHGVQDTAKSRAAFVPRTLGIVLETPQAIVVAFRGTEPTNVINMRSSGKISMSHIEGMGGVHDGALLLQLLLHVCQHATGIDICRYICKFICPHVCSLHLCRHAASNRIK